MNARSVSDGAKLVTAGCVWRANFTGPHLGRLDSLELFRCHKATPIACKGVTMLWLISLRSYVFIASLCKSVFIPVAGQVMQSEM